MTSRVAAISAGIGGIALAGGAVGASRPLTGAPLFTAQAIRYAVAAAVLVLLARICHVPLVRPRGREWLWLAGVAATGLVLYNVAVVRGVAHAEPAVIAVAVACVPVLLAAVGPLLEGRRPAGGVLLAAAVVTAGGVLVQGSGRTDAAGVAWAAVALGCEAAFTLLAVPVLGRLGAWSVSTHAVWLAAAMLVVLGAAAEGPRAALGLDPAAWGAIGYLVLATAAAFVLWYSAVGRLGAAVSGLLAGVAPVAAVLAGLTTGARMPHPLVWLGIAVVVGGLATGVSLAPRRDAPPALSRPAAGPPPPRPPAARVADQGR